MAYTGVLPVCIGVLYLIGDLLKIAKGCPIGAVEIWGIFIKKGTHNSQ